MKIKNYLFLGIVALMAITACKKSSTPKPSINGNKIDTDVYVAGYIYNTEITGHAVYWKNGQVTNLSTDETHYYVITGMAVYNGTIYVCGYYSTFVANVEHKTAVYWVSTPTAAPVEHLLTAEAVANGITADANGVYIAGTINEATANNHHAALWINDIDHVTNLTPTIHDSNGYGVTMNGGSIYVAGDSGSDATYWVVDVNNMVTPTPLDETGVIRGSAHAILFNGSDMYVVGQTFSNTGGYAATHWLNNQTPVRLTDNSYGNCIAVNSKGDIYVGGYDITSKLTEFWKNGDITTYGNGVGRGINAMTLVGDDLYMAGGYYTTGVGNNEGYWKNGAFKPITDAYDVNAMVVLTHPH